MTVQATSLATYYDIKQQGLITALGLSVLDFIFKFQDSEQFDGKISQADASRALDSGDRTCDCIRPRFVELVEFGVIREDGKKKDNETGRQVIGYRLTGSLAIEPERRKLRTLKELLSAALPHIDDEELSSEIKAKLKIR